MDYGYFHADQYDLASQYSFDQEKLIKHNF